MNDLDFTNELVRRLNILNKKDKDYFEFSNNSLRTVLCFVNDLVDENPKTQNRTIDFDENFNDCSITFINSKNEVEKEYWNALDETSKKLYSKITLSKPNSISYNDSDRFGFINGEKVKDYYIWDRTSQYGWYADYNSVLNTLKEKYEQSGRCFLYVYRTSDTSLMKHDIKVVLNE